jgi:hypothetical protein
MKKFLLTALLFILITPTGNADCKVFKSDIFNNNIRGVKSTLNSQIKYANKNNFDKFISTYDTNYQNGDGYDLDIYKKLVKELWGNYDNIKYAIKIKDITFEEDGTAKVSLIETSQADIPVTKKMSGILKSEADSIYYLKKINGKWKVTSDKINDEVTSMLYGEAIDLDIKLSAPHEVTPGYEYTASLEFDPPKDTFAIASIAKDKVEYPQKQAKEVFRKLPDDHILERLFIANSDNANEYIIASIGLTKADIKDMSIKLSLTGFGYRIIRVNVVDKLPSEEKKEENNVKEQ